MNIIVNTSTVKREEMTRLRKTQGACEIPKSLKTFSKKKKKVEVTHGTTKHIFVLIY